MRRARIDLRATEFESQRWERLWLEMGFASKSEMIRQATNRLCDDHERNLQVNVTANTTTTVVSGTQTWAQGV